MSKLIHKAFEKEIKHRFPTAPTTGVWSLINDGRVWVENHPDVRTSHHSVMVGAPFSETDVDFAITTKQYADGDVEN
eukprot:5437634-Amphidinium_carterae.1